MTPKLRPYQSDVLARGRARILAGCRRILIQAPTGAGKTHIISEISRCAWQKSRSVLILVHRRRLVDQISKRLDAFGVPHGVIMAGQPKTPALVQVASRDTLASRSLRNDWVGLPPADVVVLDEAHNLRLTPDESEEKAGVYQAILQAYPAAVVIGFTATPARSDGRGLGAYFQALECTVPVSQLVQEGWLVPVHCFAPDRVIKTGKRPKFAKGLVGDPVLQWMRLAFGRKTVVFTSRVESSIAVRDAFLRAGIPAEHIDAHTDDDERDDVVDRLCSGETLVVTNVGVWTEGVDVPELSCCQLLRGCQSAVLFRQTVGRVMRADQSKTDAILIDHAGAVLQHGFPDEDIEWSLDDGDTVDQRIKTAKDRGERRSPLCCPKCSMMFSGSNRCPGCGYLLTRQPKTAKTSQELLVEVPREQRESINAEAKVRYWKSCLGVAAARGTTLGAARMMFRSKFGEWPDAALPDQATPSDWKTPVAELFPNYVRRKEPA